MSFLSFLKAAEQKLASILKIAAKAAPEGALIAEGIAGATGNAEVIPFINKIEQLLTGAGAMVTAVQGSSGGGAQKLALAAPMVDAMLKNSGFLSDKVIADEQKWSAAVTGIASNFADLLNSVANKTPTPPTSA